MSVTGNFYPFNLFQSSVSFRIENIYLIYTATLLRWFLYEMQLSFPNPRFYENPLYWDPQYLCFSKTTHLQKPDICWLDSVRLDPSFKTQRTLIHIKWMKDKHNSQKKTIERFRVMKNFWKLSTKTQHQLSPFIKEGDSN